MLGGDYQATMIFNDRTVDPDDLFAQVFVSDGPVNVLGYDDPKFDELFVKARSSLDDAERMELYAEARKLLFEAAPVFYVHYDTPNILTDANVLGATARANLELRLDLVGFAKE